MLPASCRNFVVVLVAVFLSRTSLSQYAEGDACMDNNGQSGICRPLVYCEEVINALEYGIAPEICGIPEDIPIVCCPITTTVIPDRQSNGKSQQKCLEYSTLPLTEDIITFPQEDSFFAQNIHDPVPPIAGGAYTKPRECPHMAAVGYGAENDISWWCGGSLISERFVLTAAHCLASKTKGLARWVRLGDLDLRRTDDPVETQQLGIERLFRHPDYEPPACYNDIGLLKLDRDALFTPYVRPACIHTEEILPSRAPEAIGWGLTEWGTSKLSDHLLKVDLEFVSAELCNRTFAPIIGGTKLSQGINENTMLCVGDLKGGKDTCKGDSGGPLHVHLENPPHMFDVVGITSFGAACGSKNSPAIYTKVSHFVPWIESIVWP